MTNILTLRLDPASHTRFEALRQKHFPPGRNQIAAHLTFFHALPDEAWVEDSLRRASQACTAFPLQVTGLRSLGKGVAYRLASPAVLRLHTTLSEAFRDVLIPQDTQRFQPHVVVQNKVLPAQARALLAQLEQEFAPWSVLAEGLDLWHYRGGPWEHARTFPFAQE